MQNDHYRTYILGSFVLHNFIELLMFAHCVVTSLMAVDLHRTGMLYVHLNVCIYITSCFMPSSCVRQPVALQQASFADILDALHRVYKIDIDVGLESAGEKGVI